MSTTFDRAQVRRAFSRAAPGYDRASSLQREVEAELLESLDYLGMRHGQSWAPQRVLDLGSGPGRAAAAMRLRWPRAQVLAMDLALPMLRGMPVRSGWNPLQPALQRVNADARALPLADHSLDVLFCNLCLQWVEDLPSAFAGFRRVLRPGGLLLCSTFGAGTLDELRTAFADDDAAHVSPFVTLPQFGDALMQAGFRDPVVERDSRPRHYPDLAALMRGLRDLGATNALATRRRGLTGRGRFAAAVAAYEPLREAHGLPASWETITGIAWAPPHGSPIREDGAELARFPADRIPVRRRPPAHGSAGAT